MRALSWIAAAGLFGAACQGTVVDRVPVDLMLPGAPQCRAAIAPITLTALGDFPTTDAVVAQLDASGAPLSPITRFPDDTVALSASSRSSVAGWTAFGWASRDSLVATPALVIAPLGLSCPLADSEARLPRGAALAVVDEARVLFAGGLDESGEATRRIAILSVRDERVDLPRMDGAIRTAFATATLAPEGDAVLVAGGTAHEGGDALPTWERIPLDGGSLAFGVLRDARTEHAAISVDAGTVHGVLLVGGSDGRAALESIEWVDPSTGAGGTLRSALAHPRVAPTISRLDATRVAIVGGRASADPASATVVEIEILDVGRDEIHDAGVTITPLAHYDPSPTMPVPGDWLVALPSGRVAWSGAGVLHLASVDGVWRHDDLALPVVYEPVASALPSGRILLEGHRTDGTRLGFVVDPVAQTVDPLDTSRVPSALVALPDGTTLELAAGAASVRRDERTTPFDAPPPSYLFGADRGALALDAAWRWTTVGAALEPASGVDAARLDVPVLRLRELDATLDVAGRVELLFTGESTEPLATIAIDDAAVALGTCSAPRGTGTVRVSREGTTITLAPEGAASVSCEAPALAGGRVGIALVAHEGASLRSLALVRR